LGGVLKRVQCYIDGFNLYHAVAQLGLNHLKWVNLRSLSEAFIQPSKETLHEVFYFSAYATWLPKAMIRHRAYIEALKTYNVTPILGHFKDKKMGCKNCGASWISREEKGTDTNFVIQLVQEAHQNRFDKAIIITADSDMVPAIHMVLNTFPNKEILVCTPPNRYNIAREIRGVVETRKMKKQHLLNNLLPGQVYCPAGQIVATRPTEYDPPAT
jgi:uncharacterized LabA/DUF88 family protein